MVKFNNSWHKNTCTVVNLILNRHFNKWLGQDLFVYRPIRKSAMWASLAAQEKLITESLSRRSSDLLKIQ